MNERDVTQFDLKGIKSVLDHFNEISKVPVPGFMSEPELLLRDDEINYLANKIIEYAAPCGVIPPRSTMK